MLFSATQTAKVEDLARVSLKKGPLYINVDEHKEMATAEGLEQVYTCRGWLHMLILLFLHHHSIVLGLRRVSL